MFCIVFGVIIVVDIFLLIVDEVGGVVMMWMILLVNLDVDVVFGVDMVVFGVFVVVCEVGKVCNDQFFGGIDGEFVVVDEIKCGGFYKVSVSFVSLIFGYVMGQYVVDWFEGWSILQVMDILLKVLILVNFV